MMPSKPTDNDGRPVEHVSVSRRHLLKAAASTAPLIATLPSGAALAQASAINCVIEEQGQAVDGLPTAIDPAGDSYIVVTGESWYYVGLPGGVSDRRVYFFDTLGDPPVRVQVDSDGNWVDVTGATASERQDNTFLVIFSTDADPATSIAESCTISGVDWSANPDSVMPTSPEFCIGPIAKVQVAQPGNIGLSLSCYNSVSPDDWNP
jgi:hypothetical protein